MPYTVALWMSIFAIAGFLTFGIRQFAMTRPPSNMAVGSLALGAALLVLVVATYLVYALPLLHLAREFGINLILPLVTYFGVYIYAVFRYHLAFSNLLFVAILGFVGLWFFGFYAGLLVTCSFGDCL
jgi:hypothetical protein